MKRGPGEVFRQRARQRAVAAGVGAALLSLGAGLAVAQVPSEDGGVISACYSKPGGTLRVIDTDAGQTCSAKEQLLRWNQKGEPGDPGPVGPVGAQGEQGPPGEPGVAGIAGDPGPPGPSAYGVWLQEGNAGSAADFLASLKGPQGQTGATGPQGVPGPVGPKGDPGAPGPQGPQGTPGEDGQDAKMPVEIANWDVSWVSDGALSVYTDSEQHIEPGATVKGLSGTLSGDFSSCAASAVTVSVNNSTFAIWYFDQPPSGQDPPLSATNTVTTTDGGPLHLLAYCYDAADPDNQKSVPTFDVKLRFEWTHATPVVTFH